VLSDEEQHALEATPARLAGLHGLSPSIIGGFNGMCAFMGVAATFVSSTLVNQFGILKAGAVGLVFQALLLSMAVAVYWSGSISHQSPLLVFLSMIVNIITVRTHVLRHCRGTDYLNRNPIIESKSHWDNRVVVAAWMFCRWLLNPTDEHKLLFSYDHRYIVVLSLMVQEQGCSISCLGSNFKGCLMWTRTKYINIVNDYLIIHLSTGSGCFFFSPVVHLH
ncbi:hypothetical protein Lal_00047494, partial [Lupinus albus]